MISQSANPRILLYSSGRILEENPTGGEYRFLELADYYSGQNRADLCCADSEGELSKRALQAKFQMVKPSATIKFLPEEARIWLANRERLREIARESYQRVIVFDVPPAIGLVLSGVGNITLMIRKDLIGYERVKNRSSAVRRGIKIAYQWLSEELCLRKAKRIICQCEFDRDALLARHPLIRKRLEPRFRIQINNDNPSWIVKKAEELRKAEMERRNPEENTKGQDRFRVCFVGGFDDPRKGQDLLLQAAALLTGRHPALQFVLVGGGRKLKQYKETYQSEQIAFTGRLDNPLTVLASCDLAVVPSLADSCPNTMMEALYTGIPVIGSRAGGIPEILLDDRALFETDWKSLAEKIEQCFLDRDYYRTLQRAQRKRAEELSFNWAEKITELILEDD